MNRLSLAGRCSVVAFAAAVIAACGGGGGDSDNAGAPSASGERARALRLPAGTTIPADAGIKGMFGPLQNWPVIAVHGVLTTDGRVLSYGTKEDGTQTGYFVYDVWNPADDTHLTLPNGTGTDIFCSSQLLLPDGNNVFLAGGDNWTGTKTTNTGNNNSTVFNVATRSLTRANNMNRARWYSTSTTLLNGETYIQGGSGGTDFPEIRGSDGVFRLLSSAGTGGFDSMYPRNFIAPDGRVFGYDSAGRMYYINTAGNGSVATVGQFNSAYAGSDSSAAMFAPGRILQYGGNSNQAVVIDITASSTPVITQTASMLRQRRLSVATILADGKVVATGGSSAWNAMTNVSYEAEIWNPATGQWTVGASMVKPRLYHGNALLLPDASVLVFGGGAPSPTGVPGNLNAEIYYPPYLFSGGALAARPILASAPTVVDTGRTVQLSVTSGRPIARVTFVKAGSATHGWNMEQRFVDLPFAAAGSNLSVQIPARASDVPPGMWMMFVIDDAGVPSEARMVRVNVAGALNVAVQPTITSPGNQSSTVGTAVDLQLSASDPNGDPLTYSASGLPAGLALNPSTGRITGTPTTAGTSSVLLAVSDGLNSANVTVTWTVNNAAELVLDPPPLPAPSVSGATASFSANATGLGVQYRWDFGDGTTSAWSSSGSATHVYDRPGIFYVTVTARDANGVEQYRSVIHNVYLPLSAQSPVASGPMALERRSGANPRLWVVNPDNDSVTVFDAVTRARLAEVAVGSAPRTLAIAPDGSVWVVNKRSASISVISASTLVVVRTTALPRGSQPYGIAFARGANAALITLEASGQLLKLDAATGGSLGSADIGPNPRHVSVATDGSTAFVSRFITPPLPGESSIDVQTTRNGTAAGGEVLVVDAGTLALQRTIVLAHEDVPDAENQGRGFPNYLGAAAISPDGTQAYVPSKKDNLRRGGARDLLPLNFQNTVRAVSSRIVMTTQAEDLAARVDHDNASVASAAAFDPLGVYLFVALETSREVAVLDAHNRNQLMRIDVGRAPQGLVVSDDRRTLYVMNFMDRTVGVFDLSPLIQQGQASATSVATLSTVASEKLAANVLKGKQFFYDARDTRLARDRYMSCATCHNDGGHDGRVWDLTAQGEGLRNTISLRGRAGAQGYLHWSNNFDEVQDFEAQIRNLAGGTGLMSDPQFLAGTRSQPLGDPKAGVSADLDALAAYVASLTEFEPSPLRPSASTLSNQAAAGRSVFASKDCAACHAGASFTRSAINNPEDIGTIKLTTGQRLGGTISGIDVPTLRDVWATAPYLHDGSAPTLEAAVRAHANVTISDSELPVLVAYLREIGGDEPSAPTMLVSGDGLVGSYYSGITLSGSPLLTRKEAVNFGWGSGVPASGLPKDNFSVRWTGSVTIPASGSYTFRTVSDDGVRLWVNGTQMINNWTTHAATTNTSASVNLVAGQRVPIRLEYFEKGGQAVIRLQWRTPGASGFVAIPIGTLNSN